MARKERPKERSWRVYRMRGKGMVELGTVYAHDEAEAVARAIETFEIPKALQNRIVVRREE
jgi:hypothetical protein